MTLEIAQPKELTFDVFLAIQFLRLKPATLCSLNTQDCHGHAGDFPHMAP